MLLIASVLCGPQVRRPRIHGESGISLTTRQGLPVSAPVAGHQTAVNNNNLVCSGARRLRLSREKALEAAKAAVLHIITAVYWLALEDVALAKVGSLCLLLSTLGVVILVGGKLLYANNHRAREMLMCLSKVTSASITCVHTVLICDVGYQGQAMG